MYRDLPVLLRRANAQSGALHPAAPARDRPGQTRCPAAQSRAPGRQAGPTGAMAALPHRTAVRWQSTQTEAYARLGWVYQRIHDDPTPIDIAFIGKIERRLDLC